MSKNDNNVPIMYERIPAVAALNKAPGFDPVKLLRRTVSQRTNEPVMKLDLPYKKLWFRLLYPNGRIKLKALRVTEQMAIFEAQIFLDRTDPEPISSFTASCAKTDSPNGRYVEDAQEAATNEALSTAGFGLQFADVSMDSHQKRFGSEIPVGEVNVPAKQEMPPIRENAPQSVKKTAPATMAGKPAAGAQNRVQIPQKNAAAVGQATVRKPTASMPNQTAAVVKSAAGNPAAVTMPRQPAPVNAQMQPVQVYAQAEPTVQEKLTKPVPAMTSAAMEQAAVNPKEVAEHVQPAAAAQKESHTQKALDILQGSGVSAVAEEPVAQVSVPEEVVKEAAPAPSYDASTPVEEIMKVMTLEQARNTVVETGIFAGMTLGQVADKRAPNVRFYVHGGYKGNNNIFLAAAKIVNQALEQKNAA